MHFMCRIISLLNRNQPVLFIVIFLTLSNSALTQSDDVDALFLKSIYDESLGNGMSYNWLRQLCKEAGPRLAGSTAYDDAVEVTSSQLRSVQGVKVWLQESTVEHWARGKKEKAVAMFEKGKSLNLHVLALGNSVGTGSKAVTAEIIEVKSLDEVDQLGKEKIKGKIVFYNRPMDATKLHTFHAYGGAVDQRVYGASKAAEYGAVGVLVRSMTTRKDDYPHTGTLVYRDGIEKIPALAVSTNDADKLSQALQSQWVRVKMESHCGQQGQKMVQSVIGEIRGSKFPDEIILIGGHLDAWDVGQGAHDDGSGCVQSMDVLRNLLALGYKPKRTIRCVLFANEENGLAGAKEYARVSNVKKEFHVAAIESDAGGFSPRGFGFDGDTSVLKTYYKYVSDKFLPLLESYDLNMKLGGGGADIGPLKSQKGLLIGLRPDSQRYFDFHHTTIDTFDAVNERELKLGSAAMTSLVYLIDKYGIGR